MPNYRRVKSAGGTFFFTVVTYRRQPILCDHEIRRVLRQAITSVRSTRPFTIDAWVLLPDHLHCIWTLPPDDDDFSVRWALIKREVSRSVEAEYRRPRLMTSSQVSHRDAGIWQRRFWEHCIRDDVDFQRHLDYLHFNPVKHGVAGSPREWPFSTFNRLVEEGLYPADWAGGGEEEGIPEP